MKTEPKQAVTIGPLPLETVTILDVRRHDFVLMVRRGAGSKEIWRALAALKRRTRRPEEVAK